MTKAAHLLTSLIFAIVCGALWGAWKLGELRIGNSIGESDLSQTMRVAFMVYPWLFALLPVCLIIYSAVLMDRPELLPEKALLYFVLVVFVTLLLCVTTGLMFTLELFDFGILVEKADG